MRTKKIFPSALSVAAVLLCLVLVTAHFTSGMYARFVTRAQGSDRSHAAEFDVSATPDYAEVNAGENGYEIKVKNSSNFSVDYVVNITFDEEKDVGRFSIDSAALSGVLTANGTDGSTATIPVTFVLQDDKGDGTAPFTVTVSFTQID